ncbi:MAG: hypothetical protein ABS75_29055 [Pelagibacterium sp. SCN 63-23]|nr:MAG: hypothetical protein ABS75_29055 [Pelagibacterium sp. SCN 63-23]
MTQARPAADTAAFPVRIGAAEALAALGHGALLVDIRAKEGRAVQGWFDTGIAVGKSDILRHLSPRSPHQVAIPPDQPLILFCSSDMSSQGFVLLLRSVGVDTACDVEGGFSALCAAGLPLAGP